MFNIPCIIFAGGKSSRMGEDKSLLPFGAFNTLTQFQLSKLSKLFKSVYISCKDSSKFDFNADFIEDIKTDSTYAPTIGFISVFQTLTCESFFAISVDTPFLDITVFEKIVVSDSDSKNIDATIAKTVFGIEPMCGIYHRSLADKFIKMRDEDNYKLGYLLKSSNTLFVDFEDMDEEIFLNLNHPHEYEKALLTIRGR